MPSNDPTHELVHRRIIVESALRIADALESLIKFADKEFYTDDDDDLDAHHVSDSEWFHDGFPFDSLDSLQRKIHLWAQRLHKTINDDLLTETTTA